MSSGGSKVCSSSSSNSSWANGYWWLFVLRSNNYSLSICSRSFASKTVYPTSMRVEWVNDAFRRNKQLWKNWKKQYNTAELNMD